MRKQGYSIAFDKELVEAMDGAVRYCKFRSRSALITCAVELYLKSLHEALIKESEYENQRDNQRFS